MLDLIADSMTSPQLSDYCKNEINNVNSEIAMRINYDKRFLFY